MYKGEKIALVIPAYNEQKLIKPTLEKVPSAIDHVYVVNDCSTDKMVEVVNSIIKKDKRIELINHKKNTGPGQAIITGYLKASEGGYDVVVVVGGDDQMDLKDLSNFLEPIHKDECDYAKGNRFLLGGNAYTDMPTKRFFGNSMLTFIAKFTSGYWRIFDTQDGYTAITKKAIDKIDWNLAWKGYGYVGDWLSLFNVYNIRIKDVPRRAIYLKGERQSQIKIFKYIRKVLPRMIRNFFWRLKVKYIYQSFHPLVLFYFMSFILLPLGIINGIWIIVKSITGSISVNWVILCALLLIMGMLFFMFAMFFDMQDNNHLQNISK